MEGQQVITIGASLKLSKEPDLQAALLGLLWEVTQSSLGGQGWGVCRQGQGMRQDTSNFAGVLFQLF